MKILFLAIAATSFFQIQKCEAIPDDFLGKWSAKTTVVYSGKKIQGTGTETISRLETQGALFQSYVKIKGQSPTYGEARCYDSGVVEVEVWTGGEYAGSGDGVWSVSENQLFARVYMTTLYMDYSQDVTYTVKGRKKVVMSTTTSYGARGSGVMVRKGK
ncbi:MAG: hypothetical protein JHC76_12435 [Akkermansiaceae bacterium]|nr:hypothetical protein [Akkermansiaceae bacterium]